MLYMMQECLKNMSYVSHMVHRTNLVNDCANHLDFRDI